MAGAVFAQMRSFAKGMLPEGRDGAYEPVASQPDLWELRINDDKLGKFRSYHAEPVGGRPDIAVMRFHQKEADGLSTEEIEDAQNLVMAEAQERYDRGQSCRWGHSDRCSVCLN